MYHQILDNLSSLVYLQVHHVTQRTQLSCNCGIFIKWSSEGKNTEENETLKAFRSCILVDWFLVCLNFQLRGVSVTWLNRARQNKLSHLQLQDWHKVCFPPSFLLQQSHTFAGKCLLTECRWMISCAECKYQIGISGNPGYSEKACKSSEKYCYVCSSTYSYKKTFRMTEQANEMWTCLSAILGQHLPNFWYFCSHIFNFELFRWSFWLFFSSKVDRTTLMTVSDLLP